MFREPIAADREALLTLMDEFYHSSAVLHPIPRAYYERTFDALMAGDPMVKAYLIEEAGVTAGYALLAVTWSNEAGGRTVWLDELYIRPQFQGKGLGKAFFAFLHQEWKETMRFRLETEEDNDGARRLYSRMGYQELPYLQMVRDKREEA